MLGRYSLFACRFTFYLFFGPICISILSTQIQDPCHDLPCPKCSLARYILPTLCSSITRPHAVVSQPVPDAAARSVDAQLELRALEFGMSDKKIRNN